MWFVVCPKLELFKSHNTKPFTPGRAGEGGNKASERENKSREQVEKSMCQIADRCGPAST